MECVDVPNANSLNRIDLGVSSGARAVTVACPANRWMHSWSVFEAESGLKALGRGMKCCAPRGALYTSEIDGRECGTVNVTRTDDNATRTFTCPAATAVTAITFEVGTIEPTSVTCCGVEND